MPNEQSHRYCEFFDAWYDNEDWALELAEKGADDIKPPEPSTIIIKSLKKFPPPKLIIEKNNKELIQLLPPTPKPLHSKDQKPGFFKKSEVKEKKPTKAARPLASLAIVKSKRKKN